MPLADGTNDDHEDVSPPLDWKTKDDIKDAVLHQMHASPPCVKIRTLLKYYQVPFTTIDKKADGSYKKLPALKAGGRQVNDSYIIFKNLVPVLCNEPYNDEWQDKVTYQLKLSIECEVYFIKGDVVKFLTKGLGIPSCIACCLAGPMGRKKGKKLRAENPQLPPSSQVAKEFAAAMGSKQFFGGEQPGQVDIAYYGTLLTFHSIGCSATATHISGGGLSEWWDRMAAIMPDVMTRGIPHKQKFAETESEEDSAPPAPLAAQFRLDAVNKRIKAKRAQLLELQESTLLQEEAVLDQEIAGQKRDTLTSPVAVEGIEEVSTNASEILWMEVSI